MSSMLESKSLFLLRLQSLISVMLSGLRWKKLIELAKECSYCNISFKGWVSGKILGHISKHIQKGEL